MKLTGRGKKREEIGSWGDSLVSEVRCISTPVSLSETEFHFSCMYNLGFLYRI